METYRLKALLACFLTYLSWILLSPLFIHMVKLLALPEPFATYMGTIGSSFAMAAGVILSSRLLLQKPLIASISDQPRIGRFLVPFLCATLLFTLFTLIRIAINPSLFVWQSPKPFTFIAMALLVLVMNTIQCASEEFMMRIFPSYVLPDRMARSLFCTLLFILPHLGNIELKEGNPLIVLLFYATFGFWGTWESLCEGGFGYSLGVHMANNLVISLLVGYRSTALRTYPLFLSLEKAGTFTELGVLVATLTFSSLLSRWYLAYTLHHGKTQETQQK